MANKYQMRRRALREAQGRSDNPYASPRYGGEIQSAYPPPPRMDRPWITTGLCVGFVLMITVLYVQTARHDFTVCDDNVYIYKNATVTQGLTWKGVQWAWNDSHAGNWHPLTWMSHMLDWQLFGTWQPGNERYVDSWPGGHHLMNMAIHCANAVLLFLTLRLMTGTLWPCVAVTALFALHPLRVESVAWAAERKDVLCALLWMASMLGYAFYARRPFWRSSLPQAAGTLAIYLLVTLFFGLALLAKSMAVTLPCVFLLLDAWPLDRWRRALSLPSIRGVQRQVPGINRVIGMTIMVVSVIGMGMGALRGLYLLAQALIAHALSPMDLLVAGGVIAVGFVLFPLGYGLWARNQRVFWTMFLVAEKLPWIAMVVYDCQQTFVGQDKGVALNSWEGLPLLPRVLNGLISLGAYLGQLFWPAGMAPFYIHPFIIKNGWSGWSRSYCWQTVIGGLILVVVTAAVIWFWRRSYLAVGWFWFLGVLMPVIGIFQVGTQGRADRYTYLPMIGVYLMIVWSLKEAAERWPKTRISLATAAVLVFTALSAITFRQVSYWIDSYVLFEHAVAVTHNNYFAYNHIGIAYDSDAKNITTVDAKAAKKLFDNAAEHFNGPPKKLDDSLKQPLLAAGAARNFQAAAKKLNVAQQQELLWDYSADAFQATIDIKPDYDFGNNNLGVYYARKNRPEELALAEKHFRGALVSNQRYADALNNLAVILRRQGKYDEAIFYALAGLQVRDDQASDRNNISITYMEKCELDNRKGKLDAAKGDFDNAVRQNTIALKCDPNFLDAWMHREEIFILQNNLDEAAKCAKRILDIDANSPASKHAQNLIVAAGSLILNRPDEARDRSFLRAWMGLAQLHMKHNHFDAVQKCLQRMIDIDPKAPETIQSQFMVGVEYLELKRPDDAIGCFNRILENNKPIPEVHNARGHAYLLKSDLNSARDDFEQVLRLVPQFPGVQEQLRAIQAELAKPRK